MGLSDWKRYFMSVEPWIFDPKAVQTCMAAACHFEEMGDHEKAERYLDKAIAASL